MTSIQSLTTFFGWCSVINIGVLLFSTLALLAMQGPISAIHSKMFGVKPENMPTTYFQYLGNYKIAILVLNVVPYFALRMMN
jgi:hypothetical protein